MLCVTSTFPRWQQDSTTSFVLHLCQHLQQAGVEVDVLAPHAPGAALRENFEGVGVSRFRYWLPSGAETLAYGGGALFNLQGSLYNKAKVPGFVAAQYGAVQRKLARGAYDIVHAHWLLPQGWVASRLPGRARTGVVATVHGSDVFGLQNPILRAFKRSALLRADAVTVNSSATAAAVSELVGTLRPALVPMGIDISRRAPESAVQAVRERYRRSPGPLLVFVGRLVDWKGVQDLLHAVAILRRTHPGTSLCIAGDGQLRSDLERLSAELRLGEQVHFLGWVDSSAVTALQQAADVNVVPSRTAADGSREAQGLTVVEAMLAGRPLVATASGGIPDAVDDGITGLLVRERSPEAITSAVTALLAEPERAEAMAEQAQAKARSRYSWRQTAETFVDLFEDVRQQRRQARLAPAKFR